MEEEEEEKNLWNLQKENRGTQFYQALACRESRGRRPLEVVALFIAVYSHLLTSVLFPTNGTDFPLGVKTQVGFSEEKPQTQRVL